MIVFCLLFGDPIFFEDFLFRENSLKHNQHVHIEKYTTTTNKNIIGQFIW